LGDKAVPEVERKVGISAAETGDEMLLPCANGFFCRIIAVIVRWYKLEVYFFKVHYGVGVSIMCYHDIF